MFCHKKKTLKCLILSLKMWQISFLLFFLANTFCNISYNPSFCQFPNRLSFGGIVLRHYLEANVSRSTRTSIRYFMKMLANISETIIFMFLGLSAIVDTLDWNLSFIFFALLFCLVFRVLGIYMINTLITFSHYSLLLMVEVWNFSKTKRSMINIIPFLLKTCPVSWHWALIFYEILCVFK